MHADLHASRGVTEDQGPAAVRFLPGHVRRGECLDHPLARSADQSGIDYPHMLQTIVRAAFDGPPYDLRLPIFNPGTSGLARGR